MNTNYFIAEVKQKVFYLDLSFQSGDASTTATTLRAKTDISKTQKREEIENDRLSFKDTSKPVPRQDPYSRKLPPLEDPSVILTSPSGTLARHQKHIIGKTFVFLFINIVVNLFK